MEIRFAQSEDVAGILALLRQVGQVHHAGRPDIFREHAQKYGASQILSMLTDLTAPIFVAVEGNAVLGYAMCKVKTYESDPVMADRTVLYLDDLCVDEARRGQGIGKALYGQVMRYAKKRRCHSLTLNVWACNPDAVRFYEAMGLQPLSTTMEALIGE